MRPARSLHGMQTNQSTLTRITPREQRYHQHNSRQQAKDGVEHDESTLLRAHINGEEQHYQLVDQLALASARLSVCSVCGPRKVLWMSPSAPITNVVGRPVSP